MSVLQFIGGVILILFGALFLASGDLVGAILGDSAATLFYLLGVALAGVGIVYLFIAYGLWVGRGWAWTVAVVFAVIGLVGSLVEFAVGLAFGGSASFVLAVLPNAIVLSYLNRSHVRAYFGMGVRYNPQSVVNYTDESMKPPRPYPVMSAEALPTFERNYFEDVMTHIANSPTESAKVVAAFDTSGQSGVADYLKKEDPELTSGEAYTIALAIISDVESLEHAARETGTKDFGPDSLVDERTMTADSSGRNDTEREREKEKSWIERWLQR